MSEEAKETKKNPRKAKKKPEVEVAQQPEAVEEALANVEEVAAVAEDAEVDREPTEVEIEEARLQLFKPREREELKKLAIDMQAGHIFTDRHIRKEDYNLINAIFMPLMLMPGASVLAIAKQMRIGEMGCIYEYYEKACPRGINGYPMFMSVGLLSREDWEKVYNLSVKIGESFKELEV